jgi:hypothetical protein
MYSLTPCNFNWLQQKEMRHAISEGNEKANVNLTVTIVRWRHPPRKMPKVK